MRYNILDLERQIAFLEALNLNYHNKTISDAIASLKDFQNLSSSRYLYVDLECESVEYLKKQIETIQKRILEINPDFEKAEPLKPFYGFFKKEE